MVSIFMTSLTQYYPLLTIIVCYPSSHFTILSNKFLKVNLNDEIN